MTIGNEEEVSLWKCIDKNRWYWPKGFHGDIINNYFRSNNIVDVGCLSGEWDETEFNVFSLKDPDFNIMMMSNFLGLTVP